MFARLIRQGSACGVFPGEKTKRFPCEAPSGRSGANRSGYECVFSAFDRRFARYNPEYRSLPKDPFKMVAHYPKWSHEPIF